MGAPTLLSQVLRLVARRPLSVRQIEVALQASRQAIHLTLKRLVASGDATKTRPEGGAPARYAAARARRKSRSPAA
jgi:hypothetical protein